MAGKMDRHYPQRSGNMAVPVAMPYAAPGLRAAAATVYRRA